MGSRPLGKPLKAQTARAREKGRATRARSTHSNGMKSNLGFGGWGEQAAYVAVYKELPQTYMPSPKQSRQRSWTLKVGFGDAPSSSTKEHELARQTSSSLQLKPRPSRAIGSRRGPQRWLRTSYPSRSSQPTRCDVHCASCALTCPKRKGTHGMHVRRNVRLHACIHACIHVCM